MFCIGSACNSAVRRTTELSGSSLISRVLLVPTRPFRRPTTTGGQWRELARRGVLTNQSVFRQKASNPQASLQPWLEQLLHGTGQVRCYATEDANPTKQLKNKLSQAAAATGGLLILMLADESSFSKAREALIERWMANVEWPKVLPVCSAYPLAGPTVEAIIERAETPWTLRLRSTLCPLAEVIRVRGDNRENLVTALCGRCGHALPPPRDSAQIAARKSTSLCETIPATLGHSDIFMSEHVQASEGLRIQSDGALLVAVPPDDDVERESQWTLRT